MNIPNITVKYGKLLDPYFKDWVKDKYPDYEFPTQEEVDDKIKLYREVIEENKDMLEKACEFTGMEFKRNQIDIFVITATNRDMSAPLIIRSRYNKEEFLRVIIEELLHVLFGDNKFVPEGEENLSVRNHKGVFSVMRHLGFDLEFKTEDYTKAWELSKEYKFK